VTGALAAGLYGLAPAEIAVAIACWPAGGIWLAEAAGGRTLTTAFKGSGAVRQ
jgi:hypothetical protein